MVVVFAATCTHGVFATDMQTTSTDLVLRQQIEQSITEPGLLKTYLSFFMFTACNILGKCVSKKTKNLADVILAKAIQRIMRMSSVRAFMRSLLFASDNKAYTQYDHELKRYNSIPKEGVSYWSLDRSQEAARKEKAGWQNGAYSGNIYDGSDKHMSLLAAAFEKAIESDDLNDKLFATNSSAKPLAVKAFNYFQASNPMHGRANPAVVKAMRELGAMLANLVSAENAIVSSGAKEALRIGLRRLKLLSPRTVNQRVRIIAIDDDGDLIEETSRTLNLEVVRKSTTKDRENYLYQDTEEKCDFLVFSLAESNLEQLDEVLKYASTWRLNLHIHVSNSAFRKLVRGECPNLSRVFALSSFVPSVSFDTSGLIYNGVSATIFPDAESLSSAPEPRLGWPGGMYPGINAAGSIAGVDIYIAYILLLSYGRDGLIELSKGSTEGTRAIHRAIDPTPSSLPQLSARLIHAFKNREVIDVHRLLAENEATSSTFNRRDEREKLLVELTLSIFNAPVDQFYGRIDSGGTESIRLALQLHVDRFRAKHGVQKKPYALMTRLAHVAFDRHLEDNEVKIARVLTNEEHAMDPVSLRHKIEEIGADNIAVIVISAPNYAYGRDYIRKVAKIAKTKGIPLHVDGCLGAFVYQFLESHPLRLDLSSSDFDGVETWSADWHKYGLFPKGSSFVGFRRTILENYKFPLATIFNPRSGLTLEVGLACALAIGQTGYQLRAQKITGLASELAHALENS